MSKYSDHTTVGGQVLAHRVRMMSQNWKVIWIVGRVSFVLSFVLYTMFKYKINDIWNYLCMVKAVYRNGMSSLPSSLFSHSWLWFRSGRWKEMSDYFIATSEEFLFVKAQLESDLWFGIKLSVGIGIVSMVLLIIFNKYFGKSLSDKKELLSGHDYVDGKTLKKAVKHKSDITLADIPYPQGSECRHTLITGTTGSGKTNVFHELINQVLAKNERAIIVDTVGTYVNDYYNPDRDVLLNPLDSRSLPWNFLDECSNNEILLQSVADCLLDEEKYQAAFWKDSARIVFSEAVKKLAIGNKSISDFKTMLEKRMDEWEKFLEKTQASVFLDRKSDKMANSIITTMINDLACFKYLKESQDPKANTFSIKQWIQSGSGLLFFSCTSGQRSALVPIITAWINVASDSLMRLPETNARTWFFVDELHSLKRLPKIETSLAEIRKHGGCFVIGTQMVSQLNDIYTPEVTRTITGLCGTKVVMNVPEPVTAKYMSGFLGDKEEISTTEAISYGANTMRDGVNIAQRKDKREVVSQTDIMDLKTGEAFIRFPDMELVGKIRFKHHELTANI